MQLSQEMGNETTRKSQIWKLRTYFKITHGSKKKDYTLENILNRMKSLYTSRLVGAAKAVFGSKYTDLDTYIRKRQKWTKSTGRYKTMRRNRLAPHKEQGTGSVDTGPAHLITSM